MTATEYAFNDLAGCVSQRRSRQTGHVVGIYNNTQAGLDDEYPWSTVCEEHSHIVSHPSLSLARAHAADPLGWCEACMDEWSENYAAGPAARRNATGIPYAAADVDERGYFVTCPACGERLYGVSTKRGDDVTKLAAQAYAQHHADLHA